MRGAVHASPLGRAPPGSTSRAHSILLKILPLKLDEADTPIHPSIDLALPFQVGA
jgi:hypothetical protein